MEIRNVFIDLSNLSRDERKSLHQYFSSFKRSSDKVDDLTHFMYGRYLCFNQNFVWQVNLHKDLKYKKEVDFKYFMELAIKFIDL